MAELDSLWLLLSVCWVMVDVDEGNVVAFFIVGDDVAFV